MTDIDRKEMRTFRIVVFITGSIGIPMCGVMAYRTWISGEHPFFLITSMAGVCVFGVMIGLSLWGSDRAMKFVARFWSNRTSQSD